MNWIPRLGAYTSYLYLGEDVVKKESETDLRKGGQPTTGPRLGRPWTLLRPCISIFRGDLTCRLRNTCTRVLGLLGFSNFRYYPRVDEVFYSWLYLKCFPRIFFYILVALDIFHKVTDLGKPWLTQRKAWVTQASLWSPAPWKHRLEGLFSPEVDYDEFREK